MIEAPLGERLTPLRSSWPVFAVAAAVTALLAATSNRYGYHRDELYFLASGRHLAWGYPDQPPLTPLLARLGDAISPGEVWALRVPAILAAGLTVLLVALTAREMGANPRWQLIAAATAATSGFVLLTGHMLVTNITDLFFCALLTWLVARLLRTEDRWLHLPIGLVVGVGLLNKALFGLFVAALLAGILVSGPRRVLRGPWLIIGAVLAAALWTPYLVWQARHGWVQLDMARILAEDADLGGRWGVIPFQFVLVNLFLSPVWLAGLVRLLRNAEARPFRAFGVGYLVMLAALLILGGNALYLAGMYPALMAAGGIAADRWLSGTRAALVTVGATLSAAMYIVMGLSVIPVDKLADTPILGMYKEPGEQVGWPRLVDTVAGVYRSLPPDEQAQAVVVTSNYGQAGAIDRYGPERGLPAVYSGHNGYADWGPPPDSARVVLVVGSNEPGKPLRWATACGELTEGATVDNGYRIPNEEQGTRIWVCRKLTQPWSAIWPGLRHLS